jgi:hypothetical protein
MPFIEVSTKPVPMFRQAWDGTDVKQNYIKTSSIRPRLYRFLERYNRAQSVYSGMLEAPKPLIPYRHASYDCSAHTIIWLLAGCELCVERPSGGCHLDPCDKRLCIV